jgi:hypothetical protein
MIFFAYCLGKSLLRFQGGSALAAVKGIVRIFMPTVGT